MKKPILLLLFAILATPDAISSAPANDDENTLVRIANYHHWTSVTPEPIKVTVPLAMVEMAKIDPALVVS